ncbi:zinc dependent phospholipase C family protein [Dysosmobacter sp.]|uniref:zinc dependent phospholipase C family protein n=1 Tax=Dysosmobacter sp. TaxID=2591382 RepID=UPI002A9592F9|nr:zinc dependent phospholipase C family protein [Dysosmobacter sp.]MCI6054170.1 zinc dependent phospholipase C family protein [Dysosmobacter sp.]MDY5509862.1 zinc dependent phospholipase C family protein [Dysosmobacter sp.]
MQKRSHKLLASSLLESVDGFRARRFELAFLFGSFQPDCNPLTYLKGSIRAYKFRGHNYSNSRRYIERRIRRLQARRRWTMWQYYTLGKLTHYLADAFTYPHNEHYPDPLLCHHQYETDLRAYLQEYLAERTVRRKQFRANVAESIAQLHDYYRQSAADQRMDVQFILEATSLLMAGCLPGAALAPVQVRQAA